MRKSAIKILFVFLCCISCVTVENSNYDLDTKMAVSMKPEFSIFHHNDLQSKIFFKIKQQIYCILEMIEQNPLTQI